MRYLLLFLSTIWLCSLVSCIEGDEEVFLHADGSGSISVVYRVPGMLLPEEAGEKLVESIREGVAEYDDVELVRNTVTLDDGQQVITVEVRSANVVALGMKSQLASLGSINYTLRTAVIGSMAMNMNGLSLAAAVPAGGKAEQLLKAMLGDIDVQMNGLAVELKRDVDLASMFDENLGGKGLSLLGDSEFRYTIHLPKAAKESNAHEVLNDGKTLKWAYRLADSKEVPITLNVTAPIPMPTLQTFPWWFYAAIAVLVLLVVVVFILILRAFLRRRK